MLDSKARQQALDISQSFIVQAPAGSGKTELLTQRYLNLLAHAQKAPEEIIAITFTRKAAAEMRARIIQSLVFAQTFAPEKNDYRHTTWSLAKKVLQRDEQLQWNLLQNPNRLRILTIDALSAFICKQTPLLTEFGGLFSITENAGTLYQLAAQRALTESFLEKQWQKPLEQLLLHLDNRVDTLEALLVDLLSHRDQWLPSVLYCMHNHHAIRESLENSLQRLLREKMQNAATAMPQALRQILVLLAQHAGNYCQANDPENLLVSCKDFAWRKNPSLNDFKNPLHKMQGISDGKESGHFFKGSLDPALKHGDCASPPVQAWLGLANLLLTQEGQWRKTVDKRNGFDPKDENKSLMLACLTELHNHPDFLQSLRDLFFCPPEKYTETQWETLTTLTQLLPLLAAQLSIIFQEKKQIDFIELNLSALKALGDEESPTDLALYLDYQIKHLLIDEFQDTSITHLHLLEKITAGWQPNDGRTLFLVGDPMQSIYRFRNAEVGLFLRAQQQGLGQIKLKPLTLTMNFRSQANLVTWFNNTFNTIFPAVSDIATGRVPYTPAVAAKEATTHNVQFYPLVDTDDDATPVVENIVRVKTESPNDSMAILVRTRAQLTNIISLLHEKKLSFQAIDIESLADRPEIRDLLSLTQALLHRADRIAWLAILRAPFCGLLLSDLEAVARASEKNTLWDALLSAENITELSAEGLSRIQRLRYFLQQAFATQSQHPLSQWIEGVWLALNGPACLKNSNELHNSRAYFDLFIQCENESEAFSIEQLQIQCKKLFANTRQTDKNAIQIMTIHKSKGLEFDHVFLPSLDRTAAKDETKLLRWCDRPSVFGGDDLLLAPIKSAAQESDAIYDCLKNMESEKQEHEMTRLLYVAATRAKKSLHLFGQLKWDEKKQTIKSPETRTFLGKLWPVYEVLCRSLSPKNILEKQVPEKYSQQLIRICNNPHAHYETAPEDKTVKIDITLRDTKSRIIGTVIHEIIKMISENKNFTCEQSKARLSFLGILPSQLDESTQIIMQAIQNLQSDNRGQWILSLHHDAHSEWSLGHSGDDNDVQHKIIDRSFIDEHGQRWIIDYKTSMPNEHETMEDFLERQKADYEKQLRDYASTLSHWENNPIKLGLYFPLCKSWIEWR